MLRNFHRGLVPSLRLSPDAVLAKKADETAARQPAIRLVIRSPPRRPEGDPMVWSSRPKSQRRRTYLTGRFPPNQHPAFVRSPKVNFSHIGLAGRREDTGFVGGPSHIRGQCKWSARRPGKPSMRQGGMPSSIDRHKEDATSFSADEESAEASQSAPSDASD